MSEVKNMQQTEANNPVIYEVGYLLLSTIAEEQVGGIVAKIKDILGSANASIIDEGAPTMRALSYTMVKEIETKNQKFDHAYFGWIKFEVESSEVNSIKKSVDSLPEMLRTLFVKTVRENTIMSGRLAAEAEAEKAAEAAEEEKPAEEVVEAAEKEVESAVV